MPKFSPRLLECVPNFSEGRDAAVIGSIAGAIEAVPGVTLLLADSGWGANRTVITFVGSPEAVIESAYRGADAAKRLIDMRKHFGTHPRFGAVDVCPLVPLRGVSMDEAVSYSKALGRRLGDELGISVYLYEHSAARETRRHLARVRAGGYEALPHRMLDPEFSPDFGPETFEPGFGACAVGARDILVAFNLNLNTDDVEVANDVARDIRESSLRKWALKGVRAIGWSLPERGIAQVSMNLTNVDATPMHVAFESGSERALAYGVEVTGSELVGLAPLKCFTEAGWHFCKNRAETVDSALWAAVEAMGLEQLASFDPNQKVLEYAIRAKRA